MAKKWPKIKISKICSNGALDIINLMICAKFYNNWATLCLAICVPVENWGPDFGDFPIYFAENVRVVAYFVASYLVSRAELRGK